MIGVKSHVPMCETEEVFQPDGAQVGIICTLCVYAAVVLIFTLVDVAPNFWSCGKSEVSFRNLSLFRQVSRAFSLNANAVRLSSLSTPEPETENLNGVKFWSITWVMIGHTYLQINWQLVRGNQSSIDEIRKPMFQVVMNALVTVDSFFLMTSFLLAAITIKFVDKAGKSSFNILLFIINRFWRLLPLMVLSTGLAVLLPLVSSGPVWHETVDVVAQNCRSNWWYNFIFIGNFVDPKDSCLPHFWYATADMQMLFIALIFLLLVFRKPAWGIWFAVFSVLTSCVVSAAMVYVRDSQPTMLLITPDPDVIIESWRNFHFMTYVHIAPYALGLILGYVYARHPNIKIGNFVQASLWLLSITMALLVVYGTSWWNAGKPWELGETLLYSGFHRTAWSLSVGWMIYACCTGRGGIFNRLLAWPGLFPISRLTYAAYTVHCMIIWYYMGNYKGTAEGQITAVWVILGNICVSYALAFLCHLFVEAPMNQAFKVILLKIFGEPGSYKKDMSEPSIVTNGHAHVSNKVEFMKDAYVEATRL